MTLTDPALWARIESYPLPADATGVSFEEQIVRDHGIKPETAHTAIAEYRRFLYLSALKQGRSVPTKAVDAVWHLHLTHTRDYWERFVPEVLGGDAIHHTPGSPGGHAADFEATRDRYVAEFNEDPPKGIWRTNTKGDALASRGLLLVMAAIFWGVAAAGGAPTIVLLALMALTVLCLIAVARVAWADGTDVQFGISIWADSDGGDCGSCGGGCGD